jgi:hypothetical protein
MRAFFALDRPTAVVFFGSLFIIALLTKAMPESAHELSRLGTVESLVERGTFQLDESSFISTLDKIYRDGHYYSHQPPLLSVLEAPVYWALRLPGMRFNNSARAVITYLFSLLTNGLAFALTAVVLHRALGFAGVLSPGREVYAMTLPLGTWLLPYGLVVNSHGISALLLAAAAYSLLVIEVRGATALRGAMLGLALGTVTAIEILPLVAFVPLAIVVLVRCGATAAGRLSFAAGLLLPLMVHAAANLRITGDIIPGGFHHEMFRYPGTAFEERDLTGTVKYDSLADAAAYAWQAMVAGKGYFTFAPILAIGLIAGTIEWTWWARARGTHLFLFAGTLISLSLSLITTNNFGGEAVGFRHATYLAPALLMLVLPWIAKTRSLKQTIAAGAAALSLLSMVLFASPRPWSVLTLSSAQFGAASDYTPILARIINGELLVR